jgi:hypothetical protein
VPAGPYHGLAGESPANLPGVTAIAVFDRWPDRSCRSPGTVVSVERAGLGSFPIEDWWRRVINDNAGSGDMEWRAARDEALAALSDALMWNLSAPRWEQVQGAIADVAAALSAGSLAALWESTGRLELCGPLRVSTRLGDTPVLPAPKAVREQITELIDALTEDGALKAGAESEAGSASTVVTGPEAGQHLPFGS